MKYDILSEITPTLFPFFLLNGDEIIQMINPFIKDAEKIAYKVITQAKTDDIQITREKDDIVILIPLEEGKISKITLDLKAANMISGLVNTPSKEE